MFVPSKSLCFPILWKFPLAFKFPRGSQSLCQIPRLGNLLWCLELLKQCKNFCGIIFLQFMGFLFSGSIVGLMVTSSKKTYATSFTFHDHNCCQSPCLCGRPQLTCAYTGDTQTLKGRSGSVSCGGHCSFPWILVHIKFCLCPLSFSGSVWVWALILDLTVPLLHFCCGTSLQFICLRICLQWRKTWLQSLGWEDPLEKGMATHSSVLAWRTPWTEESGGLQSTVWSQRVRHNWATNTTYYLLTVLLGLLLCSWTWGVFFGGNLLMVVQQLVVILLFS